VSFARFFVRRFSGELTTTSGVLDPAIARTDENQIDMIVDYKVQTHPRSIRFLYQPAMSDYA
jgi:hypothetical protein